MAEEREKARKTHPERLRRRCKPNLRDAREGLSSELSYTETRSPMQAANRAAAAAAELDGATGADAAWSQPPVRGQRWRAWSRGWRGRRGASDGPEHRAE